MADPSYTPLSGMKVAADGSVSYDFEGHVQADGIDLDAGTVASPPNDQRVRWTRTSDDAPIMELFGSDVAAQSNAVMQATRGAVKASVQAIAGGTQAVQVTAGNRLATVTTNTGVSSFAQVLGFADKLAIAAGVIEGATGDLLMGIGIGNTTRLGTGRYRVFFDPLSPFPAILALPAGVHALCRAEAPAGIGTVDFTWLAASSPYAALDVDFSFALIGRP